jgi:methylated-DNA-[protein]-cysteine S-methyltransferase
MFYDFFDSPIGMITIATNGTHITHVHIHGDKYFKSIPTDWIQQGNHPILIQTKLQLTEYFEGKRTQFNIPLSFTGTEFQKKVWTALKNVPYGAKIAYKDLASRIGKPKAVRAVGTALGHNQICIILPCHRILAHNGSLGGFGAGIHVKKKLLEHEKVTPL